MATLSPVARTLFHLALPVTVIPLVGGVTGLVALGIIESKKHSNPCQAEINDLYRMKAHFLTASTLRMGLSAAILITVVALGILSGPLGIAALVGGGIFGVAALITLIWAANEYSRTSQASRTGEKGVNLTPVLGNEEVECPICFGKIREYRPMECGHIFHLNCIQGWMRHDLQDGNLNCPLCRKPIIFKDSA